MYDLGDYKSVESGTSVWATAEGKRRVCGCFRTDVCPSSGLPDARWSQGPAFATNLPTGPPPKGHILTQTAKGIYKVISGQQVGCSAPVRTSETILFTWQMRNLWPRDGACLVGGPALGISLLVQRLRLCASTTGGAGSTLWGTKIPQAVCGAAKKHVGVLP